MPSQRLVVARFGAALDMRNDMDGVARLVADVDRADAALRGPQHGRKGDGAHASSGPASVSLAQATERAETLRGPEEGWTSPDFASGELAA